MRSVAVAAVLLAGCATPPTPEVLRVPYEVKTVVYRDRAAPAELLRPYSPLDLPEFLQPSDPKAVVSLDKQGLERLKAILRTFKTREDAWRAWAAPASNEK